MILLTDEEIHSAGRVNTEFKDTSNGVVCEESYDLNKILKAQLKKIYDWGNEPCPHWVGDLKRECPDCWQTLLEEIK